MQVPRPGSRTTADRKWRWLGSTALTVVPALMLAAVSDDARALPKNATISAGNAEITTPDAKQLRIEQTSDRAIIDWQSFDIAVDERVEIVQPGDQSALLNRVLGGDTSRILGELVANGRVLLVNPAGVHVDITARIDVGSLIATTANIANTDFLDGRLNFDDPGNPDARILNEGAITAAEGGLVALVAPGVENRGVITARLGRIALGSGTRFTLDLYGDDLLRIAVDGAVMQKVLGVDGETLDALLANSGTLSADGGLIQVDAAAADGVVDTLINMGGHVRARTVAEIDGEIVLDGRGGALIASAEIDASGRETGERGGTVKLLADRVGLTGEARIDASGDSGGGTVLVGGNFQGQGPEPNAEATFLAAGAEIDVSARRRGDGGRAIVWADRTTRFFAAIQADGGAESGDGGFVEVSGKRDLVFRGEVSTAAPNGAIGSLLLDPDDIVVADGSGAADDSEISDGVINFSDGEGGTFTISEVALESVAAGTNITLQANNSITINDLSDNTLTLNQTGSVAFSSGAGGFSMNTGDTIAMTGSGGDLLINMAAGIGTGPITLGNVTLNGGNAQITGATTISTQGISGAAQVFLTSNAGVTVNGAISSSEAIVIDADQDDSGSGDFTLGSSASITTSNDQLSITAEDVILSAGSTINVGSALVILDPGDTGTPVAVGNNANFGFDIDSAELQRITAGSLRIGDDETGAFNVRGVVVSDFANISGTVTLNSGDSLSFDELGGGTHGFTTLSVIAKNGVSLSSGETDSANLSTTGTLTIDADSDDNGTGDFSIPADSTVTSNNNAISIIANDISIATTGNLNAGSASVTLTVSDGGTVAVGNGAGANFSIANTELQRITAASLQIGDDNSGNFTATGSATSDFANISGTVTYRTGGAFNFADLGGSTHAFTTLSVIAKSGITFSTGEVSSALVSTTGMASFDADSDDNGSGTFFIGSNGGLTSNNNAVSIVANDLNIGSSGSLNAGSGTLTVSVSDGGTMGLGSAQNFTLDATELARITAGDFNVGTDADAAGTITASGIDTGSELNNISGKITLRAASGAISLTGTNILPGALALEASSNVTVSGSTTANGMVTVDADLNDDGSGTLEIQNSSGLASSGNSILAILADYAGNTSGTLNAGSGTIEIRASQTSKTFALGSAEIGNIQLTNTELTNITSANLVIGANSGDTSSSISVSGLSASSTANLGGLTLNAYTGEADVTLSGSNVFAGPLIANAVDRISILGDQTTNSGAITLTADANGGGDTNNDITLSGGITLTAAGGLSFTASGGITGADVTTLNSGDGGVTLNNTLTNTSGAVTVDADSDNDGDGTLTIVDGAQLNASGQTVTITAADIALGGSSGTRIHGSTINIRSSNNAGIELGSTAGSGIKLTGTELARLLAFTTNFGNSADAVAISVTNVADADAENLGTVNLDTASNIAFSGTSQFDSLDANANNGITVAGSLTTDSGNLELDGDKNSAADGTDSIAFASGTSLTASSGEIELVALTGDMSAAGSLNLSASSTVNIRDPLSLSGSLTAVADSDGNQAGQFSTDSDAAINSNNNNITIKAAKTDIDAALNAGSGTVTILPSTTSAVIGLGDELELTYKLSTAQLGFITASELIVGAVSGDTTSGIQIAGVSSDSTDTIGTITLNAFTAGADIFQGATSTFAGNLNLNAVDRIDLNQTLNVGGSLTLTANNASEASIVNAGNGITFNTSINQGATLTLDTDSNDDGNGSLTITDGKQVATSSATITITAADITLDGTTGTRLTAGTGTVQIFSSDNSGINLGAAGSSINLSNTELARIASHTLKFGNGSVSAPINVNGLDTAATAGISNTFELGSTSTISFSGAASTLSRLSTSGTAALAFNTSVTSTASGISLTGNGIAFASGVSLDAAGDLSLDAGAGSITGAGGLSLSADGDLILSDDFSGGGATTFRADGDGNGSGEVMFGSGVTVNTNNNDLSLFAADIDLVGFGQALDAAINAGTGLVTFGVSQAGTAIGLGDSRAAGTFILANDDIARVTAGNLVIGTTAAGSAAAGTVTLDGVTSAAFTNIAGAVNINALSDGADIQVVSASSLPSGTLNAEDNITISAALTNTGALILSADADGDGTGGVTVDSGGSVATNNNDLTVSASDLDFAGALNAGTGSFNLLNPTGTLVIGTGGFATDEFQNVSAASLNLGGDSMSTVRIIGLAAADLGNFDTSIQIGASPTSGVISFETAASAFERLNASASRIDVGVNVSTTQGALSFASPVQLTADATLSSNGNGLQLGSTLNGGFALTLDAGTGSLTTGGAIGGTTPLASLNASGASLGFNGVTTSGAQTYTGSLSSAGSFVSGGGGLTFNGAVTSTAASSFTSGGGTLAFNGSLNGDAGLGFTTGGGNASFAGAVTLDGASTFATSGGSISFAGSLASNAGLGIVSGGGSASFAGPVNFSGANAVTTAGGAITFSSTLDGNTDLTLSASSGNIALGGNVGATTRLTSLTVASVNDFTVGATLKTGNFNIVSATGLVDLGFNSLDASGDVSITAGQIEGKITAKAVTLKATGAGIGINSALQIFSDSLSLEAVAAKLEGLIGGTANPSASVLSIVLSGGGALTFNAEDIATLLGIGDNNAGTEDLAVEVASNQVEDLVTETENEVLNEDEGVDEELDDALDAEVGIEGSGGGNDGLVQVIAPDEIADVEDDEDEDSEGGCGCG